MKKTLFILSILFSHLIYAQKDIITVVLMVKNEESGINKTLEPFILAGLDSFLIFDTGSTDKTIETVIAYLKTNRVQHWIIEQEPFIDFSTSRNRALELAEKHFPESCFFLMPDAEWYMHNVQGLIDFCIQHRDEVEVPCYLLRITNQVIDFTAPRLIRASSHPHFVGLVHEIIPTCFPKKVPLDIFFELGMSKYGVEKSKKRWARDLALLQKEYEADPHNPRTTFYLAQTYECLGHIENAYYYFKLRSKQDGWAEENYETFYRLGRIADHLSRTDKNFTWDTAFNYYSIAYNLLPHRAEPLVRIAEHYWPEGEAPKNVAFCYIFAKHACELPYPEQDLLFIDPYIYNYQRYDLLSKAAWQVGDFINGEAATRLALSGREMPHLLTSLAAYITHRT